MSASHRVTCPLVCFYSFSCTIFFQLDHSAADLQDLPCKSSHPPTILLPCIPYSSLAGVFIPGPNPTIDPYIFQLLCVLIPKIGASSLILFLNVAVPDPFRGLGASATPATSWMRHNPAFQLVSPCPWNWGNLKPMAASSFPVFSAAIHVAQQIMLIFLFQVDFNLKIQKCLFSNITNLLVSLISYHYSKEITIISLPSASF